MSDGRLLLAEILAASITATEDNIRPVTAELRPYRTAHEEVQRQAKLCHAARTLALIDGRADEAEALATRLKGLGFITRTTDGAETIEAGPERKWPPRGAADLARRERHLLERGDLLRALESAVAADPIQDASASERLARAASAAEVQGILALRINSARVDSSIRHVEEARKALREVACEVGDGAPELVDQDLALLDEETPRVARLLVERFRLKGDGDHAGAERLRQEIEAEGFEVTDTGRGQVLREPEGQIVRGA